MRGGLRLATLPLPVGDVPDWRPLVDFYLARFLDTGVAPSDVDALEWWAANATAFDATGSWRARIVGGELWIKSIRFHSHWMERASVLRKCMYLSPRRHRCSSSRRPAQAVLGFVGHSTRRHRFLVT